MVTPAFITLYPHHLFPNFLAPPVGFTYLKKYKYKIIFVVYGVTRGLTGYG